jgi:actin related protein 2/3 complex, subunit 2
MEAEPDNGFNVALEFNCDNLANPEETLNQVSQLKRHLLGGPIYRAFLALASRSSPAPGAVINYRRNEVIYVCPSPAKVTVVYLLDFADPTDQALAKVFLQEFVEAQRTIRAAPPVSFSKEPPQELSSMLTGPANPKAAGYLSFAFEDRHVQGDRLNGAVTMLTGFRNYLHYHIKCSKTYLHMRMRKRVAGWLQVLNRAVPEAESEKKTATGKTFARTNK